MKGILFKPDVWKAKKRVLEQYGEAVTRRLDGLKEINQEPSEWYLSGFNTFQTYFCSLKTGEVIGAKPRYQVGDIVYIKEVWCHKVDPITAQVSDDEFWYRLDNPEVIKVDGDGGQEFTKAGYEASPWLSPLFMPQKAARDFIQIVGVRAERLQSITGADIIKEGVPGWDAISYLSDLEKEAVFKGFWDSINKEHPWAGNPFVFRYEFKRVEKPAEATQ